MKNSKFVVRLLCIVLAVLMVGGLLASAVASMIGA